VAIRTDKVIVIARHGEAYRYRYCRMGTDIVLVAQRCFG